MRKPCLLILALPPLALAACGGDGGSSGRDRDCPRLEVDDTIAFTGGRFDGVVASPLRLTNPCTEGGDVQLDRISLEQGTPFRFAAPPFRNVDPGQERSVRMEFRPRWPTYRYDSQLEIEAGGELHTIALVGEADPDQDGDGYEAVQVGGPDCNDRDPLVFQVEPEVDDGIDNDCDGIVDEDFVPLGAVRITEVLTQPRDARAEYGVWVEVVNVIDREVDLRGWRIEHAGGRLQVVDPTPIAPGARLVLGVEPDITLNGGVRVNGRLEGDVFADEPTGFVWMSDGVHQDVTIDSWTAEYGYAMELDERAVRAEGDPPATAWCPSRGQVYGSTRATPGRENRTCPDLDFDGDGFTEAEGDCDDSVATTYPSAFEAWNDRDDNCDSFVDTMWIEERLEAELLGVSSAAHVSVGPASTGAADSLVVLDEDEIHVVEPTDPWAGRPVASAASSSIQLEGFAYGALSPELARLGAANPEIVASLSGIGRPQQVVVFGVPGGRKQLEEDLTRVSIVVPPVSRRRPELADLDGDGIDEVMVHDLDTVRALDLGPGVSGAVELADVTEASWSESGVRLFGVQATDFDDDGYDDLDLKTSSSAGADHWIISGGVALSGERSLLADRVMVVPGHEPITFTEVHGDGARDLVAMSGSFVQVWMGPLSDPPGAATLDLEAPKGHFFADMARIDVDGDGLDEVVSASWRRDDAGRAWFLDETHLRGAGSDFLVDFSASQWAPSRTSWSTLPGIDVDGDGRDSLLFWASGPDGSWLQRVPARP